MRKVGQASLDRQMKLLKDVFGIDGQRQEDRIVVHGDLNISAFFATVLPDLSDVCLQGSYYCGGLGLTSLKGAPFFVEKEFYCGGNALTTLAGAPGYVGGSFECQENELTDLSGGPSYVGYAYRCGRNKLASLRGAPREVAEFDCNDNKLQNLIGGPRNVFGSYMCLNNLLTSLEGAPAESHATFNCGYNQLTSAKHAPLGRNNSSFLCKGNPLRDFWSLRRLKAYNEVLLPFPYLDSRMSPQEFIAAFKSSLERQHHAETRAWKRERQTSQVAKRAFDFAALHGSGRQKRPPRLRLAGGAP